jgi:hypothetical protein
MTTAVTGFKEPFVDTRPFYRGTYFQVVHAQQQERG